MRLSFGLEARQVQTQKMAPRMIQSMEILQLPLLALQERIEQELIENPVLETQEETPAAEEETDEENENPNAPAETERELVVDEKSDNVDDFERLLDLDREVPDYFDERPRVSSNRMDEDASRKHDAMANVESRHETLNDYLLHQLGELDLEAELELMCTRIISSLDAKDGGYLRSSVQDLLPPDAKVGHLEFAEKALEIVQQFDPRGVAARDLRECLLLQLTPELPYYVELRTLIMGHLEDLRDNRLPAIQKATGYSIEMIHKVWDQLKKLNPKPGSSFADTFVATATPDVRVERTEDGKYKVIVDDDRTPNLFISDYYRRRLQSGEATAEEKEYIKRKVNAAQWLIESIQQRRNTLTRVAQAVVDYQVRFLEEGPEAIEPLKMQQIADQVGVHVTTVSRAVDDKWLQTPRGILALRRFFVGGTQTAEGEEVAWDTIRLKLQEVIDAENKKKPYSDDQLVEELAKHGLQVARRTITKYRQKMGIPSSRQRRDWTKQ
ncbi:MAG: RNA polymerase factor sigma-54 [Pirellulaceae bacterium]|jgi:RNA polymerase sigma-54 factor|nr:RNA polymerase factor sigma-54 [Pirellulaceae bacterium]MDP6555388.1 RNA polymerase factor sigma-54 [Pirellulaceae bacterium]